MLPPSRSRAPPVRYSSATPQPDNQASKPRGKKRKASGEGTNRTDVDMQDRTQLPADPEEAWEQYRQERIAETHKLAALARQPMARVTAHPANLARGSRESIAVKQEILDEDEDNAMLDLYTTQKSTVIEEDLPMFIKPSIEEEDIKPVVEAWENPDESMAEDTQPLPDQLEEINAATYAPSRTRRDERAMLDELTGMDIRRPARSVRSVAPPRDRSSTPTFSQRYQSGTVTRSRYKERVATVYNPDVELGEGVVRRQVVAKRRTAQAAGKASLKIPYGQKSRFMLEADMKTMVKETAEAEAEAEADEDEEMEEMEG